MSESHGPRTAPDSQSSSNVRPGGPFFTVVIPTMNRANLLAAAVRTVLWQTFEDFELIVSDNSNDDKSQAQNQAEIEKYASDSRVHYIRPDRWMNMPDHWEFATRHASGRYVAILTDRHVMRPSALSFLHSTISSLPDHHQSFCWHDYSAFLTRSGILFTRPYSHEVKITDSKKLAASFARYQADRCFTPHAMNSCYRRDLATRIRARHGRLFLPISPDDTSSFLIMAHTESVVYLDRPLYLSHSTGEGMGMECMTHTPQRYLSTLKENNVFDTVPLGIDTVVNLVVRDLLCMKTLVGDRLSGTELDLTEYYLANYREFLDKERLGSPADIDALVEQWWGGVDTLTPEQQAKIKEHVKELDRQRASFVGLRRLVARMGLSPWYHSAMGKFRYLRQRLAGKPVYADVFEAAQESDYLLTDRRQKATP